MTVAPFQQHEVDPFDSTVTALPRRTQMSANMDQFERMGKWLELFMGTAKVAGHLANTNFVPEPLRGRPEDIAAAMMKGLELGIDPLDALANMFVVKGRVGFSAEFMRRRVIEAGHEIQFDEQTDERCKVRGRRKGSQEWTTVVFTKQQANAGGVQNMAKWAADMLVARATSRLCRRVFPDVMSGAQIIEDVIDGVVVDMPSDEASQPTQGSRAVLQRKPRQRKAAEPAPAEPQAATPESELNDLDDFPAAEPAEPPQQELPPTDEPPQGDEPEEPASTAQNRKMHALFRDAAITDREDRLAVTGHILGYTLGSSSGITKTEASKLIDTLEHWATTGDTDDQVREILNTLTMNETADAQS